MSIKAKILVIFTLASLAQMCAMAKGLYFVSGCDSKRCDMAYAVQTDQPNQTIDISPIYASSSVGEWYVKTEGTTLKKDPQDTTSSISYTYPTAGLHVVKVYPGIASSNQERRYVFSFQEPDSSAYFKKVSVANPLVTVQMKGCGMEYLTIKSQKIENDSFLNCSNLTKVVLADGVETIGSSSFRSCVGLESVNFPSSMKIIGNNAFWWCVGLKDVTVHCQNLGDYAFYNCQTMTNLIIEAGVTNIGYRAFSGCYQLKEVVIPDSVIQLKDQVFTYCNNLEKITVGRNVQSIGARAFDNCPKITQIIFLGKTMEQVMQLENYPWGGAKTESAIQAEQ